MITVKEIKMMINNFLYNLEKVKDIELSTNIRFEIFKRNDALEYEFTTLSDALNNKELSISELSESGSVPQLKCKSSTEKLILVLAGEEIVGAKQDRITNVSFIVPPFKEIIIPVSCVEQGRWSYKNRNFTKGASAYPDLKRKLYEDVSRDTGGFRSNQSRVWEDINEKQRFFNKYSSTGAMGELYDRSQYLNSFLSQNTNIEGCAMVTYINGSIVSFESSPNNIYFNQIFPDLVKSVYQEAKMYRNTSKTYSTFFSTNTYFNYLRKLDTTIHEKNGVGLGMNANFRGNIVSGDILKLDDDVVHFYSFPKQTYN